MLSVASLAATLQPRATQGPWRKEDELMKRTLVVGCTLALVVLLTGAATAQVLGTIQGRVETEEGDGIPNVRVSVMNTDTSAERVVYTDEDGFYRARALASGTYVVTATLEGMQTVNAENQILQTGQTLDLDMAMGAEEVAEVITVTSESALVETSRSSAASYVSQEEVEALPIVGRDFKEFAYLTPTVQNDTDRGFITMAGQRGIYTAMNVDGTNQKSGFFGYGRGGEATENDGLVVAQDSVKEFQVVTNGFAPEYGWSGGGYVNVVTKSGSNTTKATGFVLYRDDSMAEDIPATPLDISRGNTEATPVDEFERTNFGLSVGGPIKRDRTHYFVSYDSTSRDTPFKDNFNTRGGYDAVLQRAQTEPAFAALVDGYTPNNDGVAAADPINGRTASGTFVRSVDNQILFGKLDFQINASNTFTFRMNLTDYERTSTFKDEESLKTEETDSWVIQNVTIIGSDKINEARVQYAGDELDRLSQRVGEPIEAQIRFRDRVAGRDSVGKFDFLPIFVEEEKLQIQNNFSYLFGEHDLKFGIDYQKPTIWPSSSPVVGRWSLRLPDSLDDFPHQRGVQRRASGSATSTFPNYDEKQVITSRSTRRTPGGPSENRFTLNYGFRYSETEEPEQRAAAHLPRGSCRTSRTTTSHRPPNRLHLHTGRRGAIECHPRWLRPTSTAVHLRCSSPVRCSRTGIFPFLRSRSTSVRTMSGLRALLGTPIDNENPPADAPNSPAFVDPNVRATPETMRIQRRLRASARRPTGQTGTSTWSTPRAIESAVERRSSTAHWSAIDDFGRPVWSRRTRPLERRLTTRWFTRQSVGESEYTAITIGMRRRFSAGGKIPYTVQGHYTWSEDKDTDSNERSATGVTLSSYQPQGMDLGNFDKNYDWGLSDRDVENRFLISGLVEFPYEIRLSGIVEYRDGRPWTAVDGAADFAYCGFGNLGFNCNDVRAVINGERQQRNNRRSESISKVDLRLSKLFSTGNTVFDVFFEAFNVFDENSFGVGGFDQRDATGDTFGIADTITTVPRQYQIGVRVRYN